MSCDIRKYNCKRGGSEMVLTAFVGGMGDKSCIQFTIDGHYCTLNQKALFDLIDTIQNKIDLIDGYTATGQEREDITYKEVI
jgi:hypothetical protein